MEGLSHLLPNSQAQSQAFSLQPVQHSETTATTSVSSTANNQMATGPSAQSADISSKVSPAGVDSTLSKLIGCTNVSGS